MDDNICIVPNRDKKITTTTTRHIFFDELGSAHETIGVDNQTVVCMYTQHITTKSEWTPYFNGEIVSDKNKTTISNGIFNVIVVKFGNDGDKLFVFGDDEQAHHQELPTFVEFTVDDDETSSVSGVWDGNGYILNFSDNQLFPITLKLKT